MSTRGGRGGRGHHQPSGGHRGGGGSFRGGRGGGRGGYQASGSQVFSLPGGLHTPGPDQTVTRIEDALQQSTDLAKLSLQDSFPNRPGYGTKGTGITLWANYVVLETPPSLVLHRYDISVTPAATGKKLTQIIRLLLETSELLPRKDDVITDFKSTLVSRQKFDDQSVAIRYRAEGEDEPRASATEYTVNLRFTNVLAAAELMEYLTSTDLSARYDEKLPIIQAFNIFLNHYAKSSANLATIGSARTFPLTAQRADSWDLGRGLSAVRGFFASVRAATARVLVNVNVSHGVFYQQGRLDELLISFGSQKGLYRLEVFLKRLRVRTTHLAEKVNKKGEKVHRVKTIFGLANKNDGHGLEHPPRVRAFGAGPKDVEFWLNASPKPSTSTPSTPSSRKKGGKGTGPQKSPATGTAGYISVYDFFVKTHGIKISQPNMPVVNVGNRENPSYLPVDVCMVMPGQAANTKLDPSQTQQMIRFAVRKPWENASSITTQGLDAAGLSPATNPRLGVFGLVSSPNMIVVPGRVLVMPKVMYKQNMPAQMMAGGWNMVPRNSPSLKFNASGTMKAWSCLYIEMPEYPAAYKFPNQAALQDLLARFTGVLRETGITATRPPQLMRLQLNGTDDPQLENTFKAVASSAELLFVILPATPIPLYNRIKRLGDVKYGIHTVCTVGTKIAKPQGQDQYFRNVALKFNLKLGGNNHLVEPARLGLVTEDKTMVVGIDVTHPSPGSSPLAPSVAGMVASVNGSLGQWPGVLSIQSERRKEMVSHLKDMLKSRLRLWMVKGKHKVLPENILVYRDGVSEGQYQAVMDEEVPLLRAACKEVYPPADQAKGIPRFTVVVVGKRHHTRFYPTKEADADRSGNTKPGTVVDRGVTEARSWDFFLQAHTALQGTARPAHYFVVLDEIFRHRHRVAKSSGRQGVSDEMQDLTQSMCYVFGRATKAVSICTPAYYADILCERARCYLSSSFESPGNSAAPSVAGSVGGGAGPSPQDVRIHERLKDSMFYI